MEYFYLNKETGKWSVIRDIYEGFNPGTSKENTKIPFGYKFENTKCIKLMSFILDKQHFNKLLIIVALSRITLTFFDDFKITKTQVGQETYAKRLLKEYVDTLDIATWIKVLFKTIITIQKKDTK